MITADYTIELINDQAKLIRLAERLASLPVCAVDIETIEWWNRQRERIALIQIAYRTRQRQVKVAIVDAFANLDLETLRACLESETTTKVIHNAVFDAGRLATHFRFRVAPIFDTMVAARRGGEKRYSLKAQAETHLGLRLDKSARTSDWSRRPLDAKQIYYAALDAFAALLLYEHQTERQLNGSFQLKEAVSSKQARLPLTGELEALPVSSPNPPIESDFENEASESPSKLSSDLSRSAIALLGVVTELSGRYHPDGLAVSVGSERVGLAGWIVDRILGAEADLDEETAKLGIVELIERKLVVISEARRLVATAEGARRWEQMKSKSF